MNLGMLLDMAADGHADRIALGGRRDGVGFAELRRRARRVAALLAGCPGERVGLVDLNSDAVPLALLGAGLAGKPFAPVNYRLADAALAAILRRMAPATVIVGSVEELTGRVGAIDGITALSRSELLDTAADGSAPELPEGFVDPDEVAVLLFTSGTTGEPKAAVLRHRNLAGYVLSTVEFGGADPDEATLVSVPPYHVAGVAAVLSNLYAGRRAVRLAGFDPAEWVRTARAEGVTHAMVVPTMLGRILDALDAESQGLPGLRALTYGGGPMPTPVLERALRTLPEVGFVNAYGLTETSSTIAVLTPEDHRAALAATDAPGRARLGSVGRPLPSVRVSVRDPDGVELPAGEPGEIWVAGDQVSGEYLGSGGPTEGERSEPSIETDGWFRTRDAGTLDEEGYLFVHGRLDDVIVRGGENLSPGEIEAALLEHPEVADAAVFGVPDTEWGEAVAAAVVLTAGASTGPDELRAHVRTRLRSTCTPAHIQVRDELPYTETGKLLRRKLRDELSTTR
jgi:acyl-CoA synthetase (AMP-forming)/AMP-acid ligase II